VDRSKGRGQTKRGTLVLQVVGLSVGTDSQTLETFLVTKTTTVKNQTDGRMTTRQDTE